jgi:hypothetical protein
MTNWKLARIVLATALFGLFLTPSGHAWGVNHENRLTFSRPVSLPGVTLPAGSYSFDLADTNNLDIVVVRNAKRTKTFYMGFTNPVDRPRNLAKGVAITLGEARPNEAPPITAWYPIGDTNGHEFRYR